MGFAVFMIAIVLAIIVAICDYFIGMNNSIKDMKQKLSNIEELLKDQNN